MLSVSSEAVELANRLMEKHRKVVYKRLEAKAKKQEEEKMKVITKVYYDEDCVCEVGKEGVTEIRYHSAQGEGDRHYCEISFDDGCGKVVFDIKEVRWIKKGEQ